MDIIRYIFSFLCSQDVSRSFDISGHFLPVCQRCTGLYLGMGISVVYLLVSRHYRKGFWSRRITYLNIACLLAMPVFGFHLLDPGSGWRLWSGLVYGNALVFLLLTAASIIYNQGKRFDSHTRSSAISFWILFAFLNSIPLWFPIQSAWIYSAAVLLMLAGLLGAVFCVAAVTVFLIKRILITAVLKGFCNEYARSQDSRL